MIRRLMTLVLALTLLATASSAALAASPFVKIYTFDELVFDSEVQRPSASRFEGKARVRFGRLSHLSRSFMCDLIRSDVARLYR